MALPRIDLELTGQKIKEMRNVNGISVKELADVLGFSNCNAIYKWQNGVCLPTIDNLVVLGEVFGVNIGEIIVIRKE